MTIISCREVLRGVQREAAGEPAGATFGDHSLLSPNPLLPKDEADMLQLMKASLLFHQDSHILEITTPVLPACLPVGFACRLLPPPAPPLLAPLLAGTWLFSTAARIQLEEALPRPGRRFRTCFGAEWQQCAFAHPIGLPNAVATSAPVTAGLRRAGARCHVLASTLRLQLRAAILQMLPPKDIPASSARKMLIRKKVNRER